MPEKERPAVPVGLVPVHRSLVQSHRLTEKHLSQPDHDQDRDRGKNIGGGPQQEFTQTQMEQVLHPMGKQA